MVFSARSAPEPAAGQLRSVRQSLNSPVVAIAELPVGPARAVIAVHSDRHGGAPHITIAVRCQRTGAVAFFSGWEEFSSPVGPGPCLAGDVALPFAESLGFLFDSEVGESEATPGEAARIWGEFAGAFELNHELTAAACPEGAPVHPMSEDPARTAMQQPILLTKFRFIAGLQRPAGKASLADRKPLAANPSGDATIPKESAKFDLCIASTMSRG